MQSYHSKPFDRSSQNALETPMAVDEAANTVVCEKKLSVLGDANFANDVDVSGGLDVTGAATITGALNAAGGLQVAGGATYNLASQQVTVQLVQANAANAVNAVFTQANLALTRGVLLVSIKLENNTSDYGYLGVVTVGTGSSFYSLEPLYMKGFTDVACADNSRTITVTAAGYGGADTNIIVGLYRFNVV